MQFYDVFVFSRFFLYVFLAALGILLLVGAQQLVSSLSVSHLERFLLLLYEMHCSVSALPLCNVKACLFAQCKSSREISVVV